MDKLYNDRIDQMKNTIHDLKAKQYALIEENKDELVRKDKKYREKYEEISKDLTLKFQEIQRNNDKLEEVLVFTKLFNGRCWSKIYLYFKKRY